MLNHMYVIIYPYHIWDYKLYIFNDVRYEIEYRAYFHCRLYSILTDGVCKLDDPRYKDTGMSVFCGDIFVEYLKWKILK